MSAEDPANHAADEASKGTSTSSSTSAGSPRQQPSNDDWTYSDVRELGKGHKSTQEDTTPTPPTER